MIGEITKEHTQLKRYSQGGVSSLIVGALVYVLQNSDLGQVGKNFILIYMIPILTLVLNHYIKSFIKFLDHRDKKKSLDLVLARGSELLKKKNLSPEIKKEIAEEMTKAQVEDFTNLVKENKQKLGTIGNEI